MQSTAFKNNQGGKENRTTPSPSKVAESLEWLNVLEQVDRRVDDRSDFIQIARDFVQSDFMQCLDEPVLNE
jgi:hypothetical protein